jgi:hypothetical protein
MDQTSISASTSQSQSPDQGSKVKASQWIKMLDLKTPTKNSQDVPLSEMEDSAKKRKKYKKYAHNQFLFCFRFVSVGNFISFAQSFWEYITIQ